MPPSMSRNEPTQMISITCTETLSQAEYKEENCDVNNNNKDNQFTTIFSAMVSLMMAGGQTCFKYRTGVDTLNF
jgi:hypothetical protein